MKISIRILNVRIYQGSVEQGPHCRAIGFMPSGQLLIEGRIVAGHSPSAQEAAVSDVTDWLRANRSDYDVEVLPGIIPAGAFDLHGDA